MNTSPPPTHIHTHLMRFITKAQLPLIKSPAPTSKSNGANVATCCLSCSDLRSSRGSKDELSSLTCVLGLSLLQYCVRPQDGALSSLE